MRGEFFFFVENCLTLSVTRKVSSKLRKKKKRKKALPIGKRTASCKVTYQDLAGNLKSDLWQQVNCISKS